jgi:hypothetical protein
MRTNLEEGGEGKLETREGSIQLKARALIEANTPLSIP